MIPVSSVPAPTGTWQLKVRHENHDGIPTVAGSTSSGTGTAEGNPGDFRKQNGIDAQKLNAQFKTMKASDGCQGEHFPQFSVTGL